LNEIVNGPSHGLLNYNGPKRIRAGPQSVNKQMGRSCEARAGFGRAMNFRPVHRSNINYKSALVEASLMASVIFASLHGAQRERERERGSTINVVN